MEGSKWDQPQWPIWKWWGNYEVPLKENELGLRPWLLHQFRNTDTRWDACLHTWHERAPPDELTEPTPVQALVHRRVFLWPRLWKATTLWLLNCHSFARKKDETKWRALLVCSRRWQILTTWRNRRTRPSSEIRRLCLGLGTRSLCLRMPRNWSSRWWLKWWQYENYADRRAYVNTVWPRQQTFLKINLQARKLNPLKQQQEAL